MSSDEMKFKELMKAAKNILVITGAGISAESGIPTFRGATGLKWRNYEATHLGNLTAFRRNPSLVWEYYHYRRGVCLQAQPNNGHLELAKLEMKCMKEGKSFAIVTQNVDELHQRAGSKNVVEIHGNLFETKCMKCNDVVVNHDNPMCESLRNRCSPVDGDYPDIPEEQLPRCSKCNGLLRPNVVWFGESLREHSLAKAYEHIHGCDICLVIGTSAVVQPVASFPLEIVARGVPVVEFNIQPSSITNDVSYFFQGSSAVTLPALLNE